ncbi:MAG: helix-turn-helix domain-containing protein [Kiritimatiellae bacterium]|nr:helix-turn-helix domain-containing protein [Kiritimatiellia bacterium]
MQKNPEKKDFRIAKFEIGGLVHLRHGRPTINPNPGGHTHSNIEINFVRQGWVRYFIAGGFSVISARQWGLFWAAFPHRIVASSPDPLMIWVLIPLTTLVQWDLGPAFVNRLLGGTLVLSGSEQDPPAARDMETAERWVDELQPGSALSERAVERELEAMLCRLADRHRRGAVPAAPPAGTEATRTEQIARYVEAHYRASIRVSDIAARVGLHPKYVMQLFRKRCGLSIHQYILQLRVAHAQRLLVTTNRNVLDIALEVGFGSASQFYEAFRRFSGCTPRAFRFGCRHPAGG